MIYQTQIVLPTPLLLREVRARADESFCTVASQDFMSKIPQVVHRGVQYRSAQNAILLKMNNVEPHDDPWVGKYEEELDERRAVFWLMTCPPSANIHFWNEGSDPIKLQAGSLVLFDDSKLHLLMSNRRWYGAAWQLTKV